MTDSSKEPSKGAMRAAKLIDENVMRFETRKIEERSREWLAEVIDRETKAGEMAAALRELCKVIQSVTEMDDGVCYFNGRYMGNLEKPLDDARRLLTDLEVKP